MNDYGRRYLIEKLGRKHDDYDEARGDNRNDRGYRDNRDNADERDYRDNRDYNDDYYDQEDERRGVRGSGRGRGRRRRRRDYEDGYDYENDYHNKEEMRLTKMEMNKWKRNMENADGTRGEHYDMQHVMHAAEKLGIKFHDFTEKQFCLATNIMYSDFGQVLKKYIPPEKELMMCADMAKAYFDDPDGYDPDEKLAIHYHCMMNFE